MTVDSNRKVSDADRAGFVARSPEGHAARSMSIKGQEEVWIQIQANTFKNWVNVNLAEAGVRPIQSFQSDFSDGTVLVALVEKLQKRRLRHNQKPQNQHHELENISIALDAIQEDGIKLVNIGNTDINNGNLKLILGLIWSLIAHYQLGASNFPPKKLMLSWLKAVLPDCNIRNFTNDWNNGIYLSALLDYCQPGLIPHWRKLNPNNGPENCKRAMELAQRSFNIPSVLEPEYLASPHLDELSGMTYLSYFMKEEDSPGYYATLDWVKSQIPTQRINNFRTDWNDGLAAAALVKAKGGPVPGFHDMDNHPENWVSNLEVSLKGGKKVGVTPVMDARDMASPNVEYLGVMSWVAQFQWINDRVAPGDRLEIQCATKKVRQDEEVHFKLDVLDKDFHQESITAEVIGPSGPIYMDFDMDPSGGRGFFKPDEMGMHELLVKNEGEPIRGAPHFMRIMPKSKKDYDGIEPCAVGSTVEVLINPHHAARPDLLAVTAFSPTNRPLGCPVSDDNGTFYASFNPDEAGEWRIHVTYDDEDIEHSPFRCMVFDPRAIFIPDQDAARRAIPGDPFTFTVDASKTGWGEVAIDVVFENRSIRRMFYVEEVAHRIYKVTFTPQARGKHRVYVYLNGMEVKGSPFALRVGKDIKEDRKPATDIFRADRKVSRYKTHEESRAERRNYFTEREIPIQAPLAPPRNKKKEFARRQSIKDFRDENRQTLFKSDHQTDEGVDLLPVNKKIAFDCPDNGARAEEIHVDIIGPDGRKCPTEIRSNPDGTFTCQFTTNSVAEYRIEVYIRNERVNVTPNFYTFDSSKVHVGPIPPGFVGMPVEFEAEAQRAGFGKMEVIVNHGRVSSHVSSLSKDRKFAASFIPHDLGRHRIDVKFNGEKVPNSPWFIEVKDPNKPLLAPGLVSGKIHVPNGSNGFHSETNGRDYHSTALRSSDFNKVDTRIEESFYDSSDVIARNRTNDIYTASRKASYAGAAQPSQFKAKKFETANENLPPPTLATSLKPTNTHKMEPTRDFGNFSSLLAPALISGNKTVEEKTTTTTKRTTTTEEFSKSSSEKNNNSLSYANNNKNDHDSAFYSTTITKPVKEKPGGLEASFLLSDVTKSSSGTFRITDNSTSRDSSPIKRESSPLRSRLIETKREPSPLSSSLRTNKLQTSSSTMASSSSSSLTTSSLASKIPKPINRDQTSLSRTNNNQNSLERKGSGSFHQDYATDSGPGVQKSNYSSSFDTGPVVKTGLDGTKTVTQKSGSTSYTSYSSSSSTANASRSLGSSNQSKMVEHKQNTLSVPGGSSKGTSTSNAGLDAGSTSPKLNSYRGTADKCKFLGETVRHFNAGKLATFELKAPGHKKEDIEVNIISPEKRPRIPNKVVDEGSSRFRIEFTTVEVGSYVIDVTVSGLTVPNSPLIAKAYDAGLIKVTDIQDGFVGELSTFRVDASKSGEGQLEISINDGDVPNAVQVLGGGKCLVTYTPEQPITHEIEVTFNGEQVTGSPFLCRVTDGDNYSAGGSSGDFSKVEVGLDHLNHIPIKTTSSFTIKVAGGDDAELAVSVQGPSDDIPVKVTGNVKNGFTAEFVPKEVGPHTILVEYNGMAVGGTPFFSKAYSSEHVAVSDIPKSSGGKTVKFAGSPFISHKLSEKNRSANKSTSTDNQEEFNVIVLEDTIEFEDFDDESSQNDEPITVIVTCDDDLASEKDFEQHTISLVETTIIRPMTQRIWANIGPPNQSESPPISSPGVSAKKVELLPSQFCTKKTEHFSSSDNKESGAEGFKKDHEDHSDEDSCCSLCCSGTVTSCVGSTASLSESNCHQASSHLSHEAEFPIGERLDSRTHFEGPSSSTSIESKIQMEDEFEIFHDEDGGEFPGSASARESSHKPVTLTSTPIGKPVGFNLLLEGILKELEVEGQEGHQACGGSAFGDPIEKCVISIEAVEPLASEVARQAKRLMNVDSGFQKETTGSQGAQSTGLSETARNPIEEQEKPDGNGFLTKALQPQQFTLFDASKISVTLAENQIGFEADSTFKFHVDPRNAGPGCLEIVVVTEDGSVPSQMKREPNGTFEISFQPRDIYKEHGIIISFNGKPISGMPMKIKAVQPCSNPGEDSDIDDCKAAHFHSPASFMASEDEMFAIPNDLLKARERVQIRSMKSASLPCDSHTTSSMKRDSRLSQNQEKGVPLKSQTDLFMSAQDPREDETKIQNCTLDLCHPQRQTDKNIGSFLFPPPPGSSPDNTAVPQSTQICQSTQETREGCTRLTRQKDEQDQTSQATSVQAADHVIEGQHIRVQVTPEKKYNHFSTHQGELVVLIDPAKNSDTLELSVDIAPPSIPSGSRPMIKASISHAKDLSLPWDSQDGEIQDCQVIPLQCEKRNEIFTQRHLSAHNGARNDEKEDNLRFLVLIPFPENELGPESRLGGVFILKIFPYANVSKHPRTTRSLCQSTPLMVFSKEHSIFASRNDDILVLGDGLIRGVVGVEASFRIYLLREHSNTEGEKNDNDWNGKLPRVWLKDPQGQLVQVQLLPKRQIGPWQKPQCNPDQRVSRFMLSRVVVEASYCPTIPGNHIMHISWKQCELVGFPKKVGVINQKSDGRRQTEAKLSHGLSNPEKIDAYSIATDGQTISCRVPRKVPLNKFSIVEVHSSNPLASPKSLTATLVPTSGCDKSGNNGAGGPPTPVLSQGGSSSSSWSRAVVVQQTGHRTYHIILHPRTIGEHMVHVFYNHEPVPGSPFPVTVTGPPTGRAAVPLGHNHIQAFGPGLEHGLLHTFRSEFICDARGAGPGHLTVKVRGPKGAFHTEMLSSSGPNHDNRIILCRYNPSEPGDYRIEIKWSGHHIPGSPFYVMIFDTQRELAHFFEYTREGSRDRSLDFRPMSSSLDPRWDNMSMSSFEVMRNCGNIGYLTMYNRAVPSSARLSDRSFVV